MPASAPIRVLIAPDSFKSSLPATEVAEALAAGWARARPTDEIRLMPMADGGEGTLEAFAAAAPGSRRRPVTVTGPDGRPVETTWLLLPDGTGVVELARTSGITLIDELRPFEAHTLGFGEAIAAALPAVRRLLLAVGGSSSTDGGSGLLTALGARFLDADGRPVPLGNGGLAHLASVDLSHLAPLSPDGVTVLTDVTHPLLGPSGSAAVFGPQKGAGEEEIPRLERNLARLVTVMSGDLGVPGATAPAPDQPGAGAAGGAAYGLLAWGARVAPGSEAVGEALGLAHAAAEADVVISGEGRFDSQSAHGKVVSEVAGVAQAAGATAYLAAGSVQADPSSHFDAFEELVEIAGGLQDALADPRSHLATAGERLARRFSAAGSS